MIELHSTSIAHGGEAVARLDGKAHFVDGAMPGERVLAEVVKDGGSWARAELREVLDPSPDRVDPPCPYFDRCGGCQWQFAADQAQLAWKREIVTGQLAHLGRIPDPPVRPTVAPGPAYGYRNRMDFAVSGGRPALLRRRSRDAIAIDECLLLDPALAGGFDRLGDLGKAERVVLRTGGGEVLAVVTGAMPDGIADWGCGVSQRRGRRLRPVLGDGVIHETVADVTLRITGDAFFQNNTAGAAALVGLVEEALEPDPDDVLLDGYAGGGLFGLTVGRRAGVVLAIESAQPGLDDLRHNSAASGLDHRIAVGRVEEVAPLLADPWSLAVVDPPRSGLGAGGVDAVALARPRTIAYVSCDPAALARDARLLVEAGYAMEWAAPVDMFPQTYHIETVASFQRSNPTS